MTKARHSNIDLRLMLPYPAWKFYSAVRSEIGCIKNPWGVEASKFKRVSIFRKPKNKIGNIVQGLLVLTSSLSDNDFAYKIRITKYLLDNRSNPVDVFFSDLNED